MEYLPIYIREILLRFVVYPISYEVYSTQVVQDSEPSTVVMEILDDMIDICFLRKPHTHTHTQTTFC